MPIRYRFNRHGRTSYLSFTFLHSDGTIDQQFQEMVDRIQLELRARYREERLDMVVEFFPQNGVPNVYNIVRTVGGISRRYLQGIYLSILQSQQTIEVEGTRIRVKVVGHLMARRRGRGRGRTGGSQHLPGKYRGLGLSCHDRAPEATAPCLAGAIALGFDNGLRVKGKFNEWEAKAFGIAERLGVQGTEMETQHIEAIVKLEEFKPWRIVVVNELQNIDLIACGEDWIEPEDRTIDYQTIYVLLGDNHFYWLKFPKSAIFRKYGGGKGEVKNCFKCFQTMATKFFGTHDCNVYEKASFECDKCGKQLSNEGSLRQHQRKSQDYDILEGGSKNDDDPECTSCNLTKDNFYTINCFNHHILVCGGVEDGGGHCEVCERKYSGDHDCNDWGTCPHCNIKFNDKAHKYSHRDWFQKTTGLHSEVVTIKGKSAWNSHWAYDFETCRGEEESEGVFKHEVFAWAIQLVTPTQVISDYLVANRYYDLFETFSSVSEFTYTRLGDSVRFHGKTMESFIRCCGLLTIAKGPKKMLPTFWAHNGAKFDGKFILDYFLSKGMELVGATFEETEDHGWTRIKYRPKMSAIQLVMVGTRALKIKVKNMKFGCSLAHFSCSLRDVPGMFGLSADVAKGEFPYGRMLLENWGKTMSFPTLEEYDLEAKTSERRQEIIDWYEQQDTTQGWVFDDELWKYLFADVQVLSEGIAAYDSKARDLQVELKTEELDGYVSPLDYATAPSWALAIYRTWFLPENTVAMLKPSEEKFCRESLHGGRTDKNCNWMKTTEDAPMDYVDFTSLYPSVQKSSVHGTYYPTGIPYWLRQETDDTCNTEILEFMKDKCGFLRVTTKHLKYTTNPTLQYLGSWDEEGDESFDKKLLFTNTDMVNQVYGWPELEEAILSGEVEVLKIHEGLIFERGQVFDEYVNFFFRVKDQAELEGNAGLRSLAKLLLNSLWGKLGQRSYPVKEWINDSARRQYLWEKFETKEYELLSLVCQSDNRVRVAYSILDDYTNLANTACQLAASVSMWGRVILHKKILRVHGARALYCDTDSGIILPKAGVAIPYMGRGLGMLVSEVPKILKKVKDFPDPKLIEAVFVVPKTYGLKFRASNGNEYTKVVCKGFEVSYGNAKTVTFEAMKSLVFSQYPINAFLNGKRELEEDVDEIYTIPGAKRLTFRSSLETGAVAPREAYIQKGMRGVYTKGKVHPYDPRFIIPFGSFTPPRETFLNSNEFFI